MSLATWRKEFYPVPAHKISKTNAVAHSLKKWRGLRKSNLRKHSVRAVYGPDVFDPKTGKSFSFDTSTCALCHTYMTRKIAKKHPCSGCPIYKVTGRPCDAGQSSPYAVARITHDPTDMIKVLRLAQAYEKKQP